MHVGHIGSVILEVFDLGTAHVTSTAGGKTGFPDKLMQTAEAVPSKHLQVPQGALTDLHSIYVLCTLLAWTWSV